MSILCPALTLRILDYVLNSLWQIPLIFAAAWLVARMMRAAGPRAEHRVWVTALLLEVLTPACPSILTAMHLRSQLNDGWLALSQGVLGFLTHGPTAGAGNVNVAMGAGTVNGAGALRLPPVLQAAILTAYTCSLVYFAGRLLWGIRKTRLLQRSATQATAVQQWSSILRGRQFKQIGISRMIAGPVTLGFRRPTLLLPPDFLETVSGQDLETVLAHEAAHVQRGDFAKNLLYEFISLAAAYHPLLWLTRARLAETREMVCDAAAAQEVHGREQYARSLLRLASTMVDRRPVTHLHAIGIFDANIFERRIMNLTQRHSEMKGARRVVLAAACGLVLMVTCASALALHVSVGSSDSAAAKTAPSILTVKNGMMAGNKVSGKNPEYPPGAKAKGKGVDGTVVLAAVISKDGEIEHLSVQKSLRADFDKSALDAVRTWRYKPYLLNGDPVAVETTINITFARF